MNMNITILASDKKALQTAFLKLRKEKKKSYKELAPVINANPDSLSKSVKAGTIGVSKLKLLLEYMGAKIAFVDSDTDEQNNKK